jgi:hypothetical protein
VGDSATAAQNFTLSVPAAPDGTMKLARGNAGATTQDILTVDAEGKVAFPQSAQSLTANGYIELPGGLIIQWGQTSSVAATRAVTYPIPFPNAVLNVEATPQNASAQVATNMVSCGVYAPGLVGFTAACWITTGAAPAFTTTPVNWIAIGY